jgi:N-methylhydantoinase B
MTPGGGGYGDPGARDPDLVARDIRRGYYTADEAARLFHAVVRMDGTVDRDATARLRTARTGEAG